jgi:pyrroloquinoline quinone biosynthesis protein D
VRRQANSLAYAALVGRGLRRRGSGLALPACVTEQEVGDPRPRGRPLPSDHFPHSRDGLSRSDPAQREVTSVSASAAAASDWSRGGRGLSRRGEARTIGFPMTSLDDGQLKRRPRSGENVVSQQSGEATILLDIDSGEYFELKDVGADVWARCQGDQTIDEIVQGLAGQWDVSRAVLEADVVELLTDLHRAGLIDYV